MQKNEYNNRHIDVIDHAIKSNCPYAMKRQREEVIDKELNGDIEKFDKSIENE